MKRSKNERIAIAVAALSAIALTSCGSSGGNSPALLGVSSGLSGIGGLSSAGCVPVTQPISFAGNGIYFDSANIIGGTIPNVGESVGQMAVGTGVVATGEYQRTNADGSSVYMNIISPSLLGSGYTPYAGYPQYSTPIPTGYPTSYSSPSSAQLSGVITLSQLAQQYIIDEFGSGSSYGYGTAYAQIPCVSQIAVNIGHYNSTLYGGNVYLYINNTSHGYIAYF